MDGTNRRMFRFTMMNHLCNDLQTVMDITRPPDRIRQDVTRSPGGASSLFLNNCVGCHSGMDPMAQAFAYYNFNYNAATDPTGAAGQLVYTAGQVQPKYHINNTNFPQGFSTQDDSWTNHWRTGPNEILGWPAGSGSGNGAKSLGQELEGSAAFTGCQVTRVFKYVCLRAPNTANDCDSSRPDDRLVQSEQLLATAAVCRGGRLLSGELSMNVRRIISLLALAIPFALSACGGGGAPTTATAATAPTSQASAYTGPAAATADVTAFQVNFWNNVRVQNRCGQCHNATSPAQMPNFARSDDVNLAYAQANTVVNLSAPATSIIVTKVSGGHNCWLADPSACGAILTTWISNWAGATGAASATQVQLQAPPIQSVGQSLNFPGDNGVLYGNTIYTLTGQYCVRCHSSTANPATQQSPYFADPQLLIAYPAAIPKIDLTGCSPFVAGSAPAAANAPVVCGTNSRFYQRLLTDNHNCWDNCASDAAQMLVADSGICPIAHPEQHRPQLGRQQGAYPDAGYRGERREPLRRGYHREV